MMYNVKEMQIIYFNCMSISEVKKVSSMFLMVMCAGNDFALEMENDNLRFLTLSLLIDDELKNDIE